MVPRVSGLEGSTVSGEKFWIEAGYATHIYILHSVPETGIHKIRAVWVNCLTCEFLTRSSGVLYWLYQAVVGLGQLYQTSWSICRVVVDNTLQVAGRTFTSLVPRPRGASFPGSTEVEKTSSQPPRCLGTRLCAVRRLRRHLLNLGAAWERGSARPGNEARHSPNSCLKTSPSICWASLSPVVLWDKQPFYSLRATSCLQPSMRNVWWPEGESPLGVTCTYLVIQALSNLCCTATWEQ